MADLPGKLTTDELARRVQAGDIDTVLAVFPDLYGRFMGKRFDAGFYLDEVAPNGGHACDYLLTVDMEMEPVAGYAYANWEKGYGDFHMVPDVRTLRAASWLEKTALVLCDVHDPSTHLPVLEAPRSLLRREVDRAREMGFEAFAGSELEYYVFRGSYRDAAARGYHGLEPEGWYIEDYHALQGTRLEGLHGAVRRHLARSGIPVESSKGEWGVGQHEINVRYADVLEMADRHSIYKQCVKEIAEAQGYAVTFMAKVDEARAGSSCHVHLSLRRDGKSAFPGARKMGRVEASDEFRWFLGGWMAHAAELMVFYAPTVNAYKRFQAASWAPTRIAWSPDNRTAGFRVVGHGESLRIECRIPGADCNPYLVYAAALASGLDGIRRKIEPPDVFEGDVYAGADLPHVPKSLEDALARFEASAFAAEAFGGDVVAHYAHFFRTEQHAWEKAVTDWERRRYFERI